MTWTEDNIEDFIRENKDKFDTYHPEANHNQHFLMKLIDRFKKIISIIPHLIKVGIATLVIFAASFLVWKAYLCPPLTHTSLKYYKIEHLYRYKINADNRLLLTKYIKDSTDIKEYKLELLNFDISYKFLANQLRTNPSDDNIINMLGWYRVKLEMLEEKVKYYKCK